MLFDEVEKAHADVFNILLQAMLALAVTLVLTDNLTDTAIYICPVLVMLLPLDLSGLEKHLP